MGAGHDNIETIYKRLQQRRNVADVTNILKELHKIVNEAIRAQQPGDDQAEGLTVDLSKIDFEKLKQEFEAKVKRKPAAVRDIRDLVEEKLNAMLAQNSRRMDYYKRYMEIVADYNREKDRVTVEETFARLVKLAADLDHEQQRAAREGMTEDELSLFDMLYRDTISKKDRERLKQASKNLLSVVLAQLHKMPEWTKNEASRADVETQVCDIIWMELPTPPYSDEDKERISQEVFTFVWQQCESGSFGAVA
jgi:type I restriction enzyme R subunit